MFDPDQRSPNGTSSNGLIFSVVHNGAMMRDPRFVSLCAKLGLCDYWVKTDRWPDCAEPSRHTTTSAPRPGGWRRSRGPPALTEREQAHAHAPRSRRGRHHRERPEQRNAVDLATAQALYEAFKRFDAAEGVDQRDKARGLIEAELDPRCRQRRSPHRGGRVHLYASTMDSRNEHTKMQSNRRRWWFRSLRCSNSSVSVSDQLDNRS